MDLLHHNIRTAEEALECLKIGNEEYLVSHANDGNISSELVQHLFDEGQKPYAIILTCADSRVAPEHIFMTGLGELFVIRVAGNLVDELEIASAVYAAEHLHVKLLFVMGHTHCGAIEAAMAGEDLSETAPITHEIRKVVGKETDPYKACVMNMEAQMKKLKASAALQHLMENEGLVIAGGVYHTHSGVVDFL